jgi:hypothetical protein
VEEGMHPALLFILNSLHSGCHLPSLGHFLKNPVSSSDYMTLSSGIGE